MSRTPLNEIRFVVVVVVLGFRCPFILLIWHLDKYTINDRITDANFPKPSQPRSESIYYNVHDETNFCLRKSNIDDGLNSDATINMK